MLIGQITRLGSSNPAFRLIQLSKCGPVEQGLVECEPKLRVRADVGRLGLTLNGLLAPVSEHLPGKTQLRQHGGPRLRLGLDERVTLGGSRLQLRIIAERQLVRIQEFGRLSAAQRTQRAYCE